MKVTAYIGALDSTEMDSRLFDQLWNMFPEARLVPPRGNNKRLNIEVSADEPRIKQAIALFVQYGMTPWAGFRKKRLDEYSFKLCRNYDSVDWEAAELFQPQVGVDLPADYKDEFGRILLHVDAFNHKHEMGLAAARWYIVSDRLKNDMASVFGPGEIAFRETVPLTGGKKKTPKPWEQVGKPWWELSSDIIMPKADWSRLRQANGEPYTGDESKGCYPVDGYYKPAELHYKRSDLRNMPPFAVALTYEKMGGRGPVQLPIVSKKFYEFCRDRKLKMHWTPVRVDD